MVQTHSFLFAFNRNYLIDRSSVQFFSKRSCFGLNFWLKLSEKASATQQPWTKYRKYKEA